MSGIHHVLARVRRGALAVRGPRTTNGIARNAVQADVGMRSSW
jgi:hypothetical protein